MTSWSTQVLDRIGDADEMRIAGYRPDGSLRPTRIVWMVVVDDALYTRSVNGVDAAWFRGTRATHTGHIEAGGIDTNITVVDVDAADPVQTELDAAYHQKYGRRYPGPTQSVTSETARAATVKLLPRE